MEENGAPAASRGAWAPVCAGFSGGLLSSALRRLNKNVPLPLKPPAMPGGVRPHIHCPPRAAVSLYDPPSVGQTLRSPNCCPFYGGRLAKQPEFSIFEEKF